VFDGGATRIPAFVVDMVVKLSELDTVCELIDIDIYTVCPAVTALSNGEVRQINSVEVDS
jgi:hypothetical protein